MRNDKAFKASSLILCATVLAACDSEGDLGRDDLVAAVAPRCARSTIIDSDLSRTQLALTRLHELVELASISPEGGNSDNLQAFDIAGDCGGWIYFTPQASDDPLVTDYQLDMQEYCVASADGDLRFTGLVSSQELSQMTEQGQLVSELHTNFSQLIATQGQDIFRVSMTDGRTIYGQPTSGRPLPAQADSPDRVGIGSLLVNHETAGITDKLFNLTVRRWTTQALDALLVTGGQYVHGQSGDRFNVTNNGEAILVNQETGEWEKGTLRLLSDNNPPVEIRPTGNQGEYVAVVPANATGEMLRCDVVNKLTAER